LYLVYRYARASYFNTYWCMGAGDVALQLGVFFEVVWRVFRPLGTWAPDVKKGLVLVVVVSCGVASMLTWMAAPATHKPIVSFVIKGNFFSSALLSELFLGMMILASWAGLPWKTHVARIAQGLGTFSAVGLITEGARTLPASYSRSVYFFWSHVEMVCYLLCLGYWIVTLWQEAEVPRALPDKIREELAHLNRLLTMGSGGGTRQ
jgi:hypothetical protein